MKHRFRGFGFTLVELIVVIGIIALLTTFAMPAFRYAHERADRQMCRAASQYRPALHAYASANHGYLPAWSNWHTWPPGLPPDTPGPAWMIELIPYIGKPDSPVYTCPSFPRPGGWRTYFFETQWCGRSDRGAMKLSDITMVGRFVLSADTTNLQHFNGNPVFGDADPDDFGGGMLLWPWTGGFYMHRAGNNVLFDDGHVSLCSRFDPTEMTFNPHRVQDHDEVTPD